MRISVLSILLVVLLVACGEEKAVEDAIEDDGAPDASSLVALAQPQPFHGLWANSFTDCTLSPGSSEDAPILFEGRHMVGYENQCEALSFSELTPGSSFELLQSCRGEGMEVTRTIYLRVTSDLLMFETDTANVTWTRCPAQPNEG